MFRGEVITDHLRREGLDQETLEAALREHGLTDLSDIEMAVLEIDGSISVVPAGVKTKHVKPTLLSIYGANEYSTAVLNCNEQGRFPYLTYSSCHR